MEPTKEDLATREVQKRIDAGDIPIRVGGKVKWYTRQQLAARMHDDFEDRHAMPIEYNGEEDD